MKLLKTIFGIPQQETKTEKPAFPWVALSSKADLDLIDEGRGNRPQILFKHSTSCGLSSIMLRRFEKQWSSAGDQMDFYILDLIRHRELSNEVAYRFGVRHQSPQLLILDKNGVLKQASHSGIGSIDPDDILQNPA